MNGSKNFEVIFDVDQMTSRIQSLESEISRPDFWNQREAAQKILKEKKQCERVVGIWVDFSREFSDCETLLDLFQDEKDETLLKEADDQLKGLDGKIQKIELERLLSGENDFNHAIVTITSGAGGTESQDWARMLFRMYVRWAERRGFSTEVLDFQAGEEAGIKGVTMIVGGDYAYGYLRAERGVHRLVRISPFDANKRRHTSFASVFVIPEVEEEVEMEINPADLRIDVYRASGPGGQGVNTTDSAVRVTHVPTKIVVQCQSERSQHKNKATAMKILKARLYERKKEEEAEKMGHLYKEKKEIAWGNQIRSYVLQPYRLVKDHRTAYETSNVDDVLDGEIDRFIEAYLGQKKE